MGAYRYAAAHMGHNQPQPVVAQAALPGVAPGDGPGVEGVKQRATGKVPMPGKPRHVRKLINHRRIDREGGLAQLPGDVRRQNAAQIAGVIAVDAIRQIFHHFFIDAIRAARHRADQAAPPHYRVQPGQIHALLLQMP